MTRRRIPVEHIDFDGDLVPVKEVEGLGQSPEGYAVAGDYRSRSIRVDPRAPMRALRVTVAHEMLHGAWERSPLTKLSRRTEEFVVGELAVWLVALLEANPKLADFLAGRNSP